ncbi:hypothetical protein PQX77_006965 [Marasmius sp. AFHP31]|nr:hypothetical protein PQX77_006965 [Marasmius sp. AFHP31]
MSLKRVDDSDTSTLSYSNGGKGWRKETDTTQYLSTRHGSPVEGASVTFQFKGTSVEVKGTVLKQTQDSNRKALLTFVLDRNSQTTFEGKPSNDSNLYQQTFYSNSSLQAEEEHSLIMSLSDPDGSLWLDYIDYTPSDLSTDTSPVSSTATDTPPGSSVAPDGATTTNQPQNEAGKKGVSTGLVVGISCVTAILTALVVIGLWWLRRRKRMKQNSEEPTALFTHPTGPNTVAPMVQHVFSQGHVHPYPTTMNPRTGGPGKPQIQYIPSQYSSATSASSTDQGQDIEPELPPYRKTA